MNIKVLPAPKVGGFWVERSFEKRCTKMVFNLVNLWRALLALESHWHTMGIFIAVLFSHFNAITQAACRTNRNNAYKWCIFECIGGQHAMKWQNKKS